MTGQLFGDRYQVGDTLGFGGMSEVHRGRDLRLGRDVAIKVLRADLARDPSFQIRFRREAQNAASLNHPAIVAVYDTGETTGTNGTDKVPYIVMEYVDGETLRDLLKREGPLAPKRAMEIVADVSAALDFSHRHGIVHRDIKPANIMMTRAGAVKVMDFGIARAVADGQSSVTATAAVIGTAQYLSPEQARGEAVDARSDVYSTGCVIYELITGAPPFVGDSPVAVAYQHVREDPKPPSTVRPGLPREMDAIVLKALNKNPLNRYQTAAELRADLVRALSGQAVQAPRVMDDAERTEILGSSRGGPQRVGTGVSATPPILAAPRRFTEQWEDDDDDESSRTKKIWGYVGIGAICLALLAGAILLTVKFTSGPRPIADVTVPDLKTKTQAEAARILTSYKLQIAVDPSAVPGDNADKGKVVSQNPSGGTPRQPGSTVTVKIGAGVLNVTVPNLSGLSTSEATKEIQGLGLVTAVKKVESETAQIDLVQSQDPEKNASVPPGSKVTISVGAGPTLVVFPDGLVGLQLSDAEAKLKALKLQVKPNLVDGVEPADQVVAVQEFKAGDKVSENQIVTLDVSRSSLFVMPDVSTNRPSPEDARAQLAAAGFSNQPATEEQETSNAAEVGRVIGQTPAPQTKLNKLDTTVKLTIGIERTFEVPPLVGESADAARSELAAVGYDLNQLTINESSVPAPPGQGSFVAAQLQTDGSELLVGSNIPVSTPITLTLYAPEPPPSSQSVPSFPAPSSGQPSQSDPSQSSPSQSGPSQSGPSQSGPSQSSGAPGPGG
ncbi:Stk1 family PASTA domain-containing Ser/Thr kinase [Nakamurella sp. A5-74]|uniref:non-specific serine/threonine protein kinase n=1 Tax=Nakamurella sp. A5-74 TaxID=3158264 RepID=A0AAU8DS18_9ACTN